MEQQLQKAQNQTTFLDRAMEDLDQMKAAAQMILDSKLAPDHFYEKKPDGKPDYTQGNVASVILVCTHGHDLGLKPLVSLQHIIPVKGLLSIKGDAAKSLIFSSGKLQQGSWKEVISGSIQGEDMLVSITATRSDTKETKTSKFGVEDAKRAGLWIGAEKLRGQDGWKYQASAWYKYPQRMLTYRCLGFLARDLFPDVLMGTYTTEEAMDMTSDTTTIVLANSGVEAKIPNKDFSQGRSRNITNKATEIIDKKIRSSEMSPSSDFTSKPPQNNQQEAEEAEVINPYEGYENLTEQEMIDMDAKDLLAIVEADEAMKAANEAMGGKNTNKKLRTVILAKINGTLDLTTKDDPSQTASGDDETYSEMPPMEELPEEQPEDDLPWEKEDAKNEAQQETTGESDGLTSNKFDIEVPELIEGKRSFEQVKVLFESLDNVAGISNQMFTNLVNTKLPQLQHYRTKEDLCYKGTVSDINYLLNSI